MKIRRFTAPSMPEALNIIKNELGDEAVILATRKVTNDKGLLTLEITAAIDEPDEAIPPPLPTTAELSNSQKSLTQAPFTEGLGEMLNRHGVMPDIQQKILTAVRAFGESDFDPYDALDMVLGKMVNFALPARALPKGKAHLFIGPTGSGKTTTLCKLAVDRRLSRHSVGFITMDNQKVGAYEQISIYADAMKERAYMARNSAEFQAAIADMGERDFLFIDTPGINPFDKEKIKHLREKIKALPIDVMVHLVMPAHLHPQEMAAIAPALAELHPQTVLFTKIDETSYFGGIINASVLSGLKMGYIANGPKVPDDLCEVDASLLASKLTKKPRLPWENE